MVLEVSEAYGRRRCQIDTEKAARSGYFWLVSPEDMLKSLEFQVQSQGEEIKVLKAKLEEQG